MTNDEIENSSSTAPPTNDENTKNGTENPAASSSTEKLEAPADFNGPTSDRKCTDVLCVVFFLVAVAGMSVVGWEAIRGGDYRVVLYPMDYDGNICGTDYGDIDMTQYKFLYPVNKQAGGVCVKKCPRLSSPISEPVDISALVTYNGTYAIGDASNTNTNVTSFVSSYITVADYSTSTNAISCTPATCHPFLPTNNNNNGSIAFASTWTSQGVNRGSGYAFYLADTSNYMNRCVMTQDAVSYLQNMLHDVSNDDNGTSSSSAATDDDSTGEKMSRIGSDLYTARAYIMGCGGGIAVVIGFLYSFFLRVPGTLVLMVWGSLLATVGVLGYIGYYAHGEAAEWDRAAASSSSSLENNVTTANDDGPRTTTPPHTDTEIRVLQGMAYAVWVVAVMLFLASCALRRRIQLAIGIVKEAAKALSDMPALILFPVLQCVGLVCFVLVWLVYAVHLASLGRLETVEVEAVDGVNISFRSFQYDDRIEVLGWYLIFCFFWVCQFIVALGQIVIAMAVAKWFFSRDKKHDNIGNGTVCQSICHSLFYHAGTAAFGALIIAVISTIRTFLLYVQRKAKQSGNKIALAVLSCLQCCLWCLEKVIKFVNKNAYIQTAMFGTNFCASAKNAFFLILRNAARVGTLAAISEVIVFIGKVFISAFTGACAYVLMDKVLGDELHSPVAPAVSVVVLSFFVGNMFMNVFSMVIATILQCFIADEEMFQGSEASYSSKSLRTYVDKNGNTSPRATISS